MNLSAVQLKPTKAAIYPTKPMKLCFCMKSNRRNIAHPTIYAAMPYISEKRTPWMVSANLPRPPVGSDLFLKWNIIAIITTVL